MPVYNERFSKCGYVPMKSGQAVFVETFKIFTYICAGWQLSNYLIPHFISSAFAYNINITHENKPKLKYMKYTIKLGVIICLLIITSCSSTKNIDTTIRDGSSFEKAIVVKSIAEEYEYVKKVCINCQFLSQSLTFDKKKPYDILELKKSNGENVSYYFDISSFFGKGF